MYIIGRRTTWPLTADGPFLDRVQAQDADLRRIEDRRAHQRAEHAAVRDAERAAAQIVERQRAVVGFRCELADSRFNRGERHPVGIAQHGHDETLGAPTATPMS